MKQIEVSDDEILALEAIKIYISNEILNAEIEENSDKEEHFGRMESAIDSIIEKYNS